MHTRNTSQREVEGYVFSVKFTYKDCRDRNNLSVYTGDTVKADISVVPPRFCWLFAGREKKNIHPRFIRLAVKENYPTIGMRLEENNAVTRRRQDFPAG